MLSPRKSKQPTSDLYRSRPLQRNGLSQIHGGEGGSDGGDDDDDDDDKGDDGRDDGVEPRELRLATYLFGDEQPGEQTM